MKAGLLAIAAFSAVAVAQPHHRHMDLHARAAAVETDWYTETDVVTATAPAVYVYVDQNGNPVSEATPTPAPVVQHENWGGEDDGHHGQDHGSPITTSTSAAAVVAPAPTPATTSLAAPVVPVPAVSVPEVSIAPVVAPVASLQSAPVASAASDSPLGSGLGVTYSPYTSGPCKSAEQISKDIAGLSAYRTIRLYGTDCSQIANVLAALAPHQMVLLGVFDIDGRLDGEIQSLQTQVGSNWDRISAITIGNELVGGNVADAPTVLAAVQKARSMLSAAFSGPIGTVDTVDGYTKNNAALCATASQDTVFVNCHPFFATNIQPSEAGGFVLANVALIKAACHVNNVVITETGWPRNTTSSNLFVNRASGLPTVSSQMTALQSITRLFSSNLFLFSAYNEAWKPDQAYTLGVERYWGVLGEAPSA